MTDPNTPTTPTNPQDLIDQALGNNVASNPVTTTTNEPASVTPGPALPTPEPLNTSPVTEPVVEQKSEEVVTPNNETVPVELTNSQNEPATMPEAPKATKPMGEDMPLAFMSSAATDSSTTTQHPVSNITVQPITPDSVPSILPGDVNSASHNTIKPKRKIMKVAGIVTAVFVFLGFMGVFGYSYFTEKTPLVALLEFTPKFMKVGDKTIRNPAYEKLSETEKAVEDEKRNEYYGGSIVENKTEKGTDEASCNGCLNGGWMVWRNGGCSITGACNTGVPGKDTDNPAIEVADTQSECQKSGGTWCGNIVDAKGVSHAFCGSNNGKACYQLASERGITVIIGSVKCKESNGTWVPDGTYTDVGISDEIPNPNNGQPNDTYGPTLSIYEQVDRQCKTQSGSFTALGNKEMWICPVGTSVACTANVKGAKRFYGNPANGFCGVIQVDTGTGHTSYSSTESCDEPEATPNPSTPTTLTTNPTLMCDGLTRTPTTTPVIGDKVTLTCAGSSTPAGSVSLSYKFRYSINGGSYVSLNNKTATTSELTIAQCGSYKVQCQTCGTINGVLTCDPNWTGATTQ